MANYGYVRVSSVDQNEARQTLEMEKQNIPKNNIYIDKQSGKDFNRPNYIKLLRRIKSGDLLYVKSIDKSIVGLELLIIYFVSDNNHLNIVILFEANYMKCGDLCIAL